MLGIDRIDWNTLLLPDTPVLEILIRGTVMYFAIFLLLRFVQKRSSSMSTADLLVIVVIADAAQNGMAGQYMSLADGVLLVTVIVLWTLALDWLGYHFPRIEGFLHPPALDLVRDGVPNERNLRSELITRDELMAVLREQGIRRIEDVEEARMEGNGKVTVFGRDSHPARDDDDGSS